MMVSYVAAIYGTQQRRSDGGTTPRGPSLPAPRRTRCGVAIQSWRFWPVASAPACRHLY